MPLSRKRDLRSAPGLAAQQPLLVRIDEETPPEGSVVLANTGHTPAFIYFSAMDFIVAVDDSGIPAAMELQKLRDTEVTRHDVIPPGTDMRSYTTEDQALPDGYFDAIKEKKRKLFLLGVVLYRGPTGVEHETRFCFVYDVDRGVFFLNPRHQYMDTNYEERAAAGDADPQPPPLPADAE